MNNSANCPAGMPYTLRQVSLLLRIGSPMRFCRGRSTPFQPVPARGLAARRFVVMLTDMSTVAEIEVAVEK